MASVSTKITELKKSPSGKAILSPSNGTVEKVSPKAAVLKSPTSKISPKSPLIKNGSDLTKTSGSVTKKMEGTSPPKVVRSSSAKSITPPSKIVKPSSPTKSNLEQSNSHGDSGNIQAVKKETILDIGVVHANHNCDVIPVESKLPENQVAHESSSSTTEKDMNDVKTSLKNGHVELLDDVTPLASLTANNTVTGDSALVKDKSALTTEQHHASGDKALTNEKAEITESTGGGVALELKELDVAAASAPKSDVEKRDNVETEIFTVTADEQSASAEVTDATPAQSLGTVFAHESKPERNEAEGDASKPKLEDSPNALSKGSLDSSATDCTECSAVTAQLLDENTVVSKQSLRLKVWEHLDKNDMVVFPRPCKGRIPNFKGAPMAAERLTTLSVFKKSKTIKVNPDKPQEMVRFHTLEYGKRVLVPVPRLREGLFQAVIPPSEASKYQLQKASQRYGMKKWGKPITSDDKVSIDLIVLGSVVVDKKGHRIGKGEGFSDLEFAMLVKMNAVNENTVIATTVHDDQVYDDLPEHLFEEYDVPVDWIITPTQVIEVKEKLPRPTRIIWSILSNRRILEIPILQKIRDEEISEGQECTLKEVDSDVEEKPFIPPFVRRRRFFNYSQSTGDPVRDSKLFASSAPYYNNRPRRYFQSPPEDYRPPMRDHGPPPRRVYYQEQQPCDTKPERMGRPVREPRPRSMNDGSEPPMNLPPNVNRPRSQNRARSNRSHSQNQPNGPPRNQNAMSQTTGPRNQSHRQSIDNRSPANGTKSVEVQTVDKKTRAKRAHVRRKQKKAPVEFILRVKNIGLGARVRDLKEALSERGIKPRDITWRGYKGVAFLHFVKPAAKENMKPMSMDEVVETLQGMVLPPKDERCLVFEPVLAKKVEDVSTANVVTFEVEELNEMETR